MTTKFQAATPGRRARSAPDVQNASALLHLEELHEVGGHGGMLWRLHSRVLLGNIVEAQPVEIIVRRVDSGSGLRWDVTLWRSRLPSEEWHGTR